MINKWTENEVQILKNNLDKSNKELAILLNKTEDSINNKKKRLKLCKEKISYVPQEGEIFKIININGIIYSNYEVSNLGNVLHNGILLKPNLQKSKLKSGNKKSKGYLLISLFNNGVRKTYRVHRLVATMFVENPNILEYDQVDHLDGNTENNKAENLEWVSNAENNKRAIEKGFNKVKYRTVLDENKVIEICEKLMTKKYSITQLAEEYGVNRETIRSIKNKKSWKEISENYNFE